jgi:hypothetical protein
MVPTEKTHDGQPRRSGERAELAPGRAIAPAAHGRGEALGQEPQRRNHISAAEITGSAVRRGRVMNIACSTCGLQFRSRRSTARFCGPRCRVAAKRTRDRGTPLTRAATRRSVAPDAVLSVTAPVRKSEGQKPQSVTLRREAAKLDPRIVPDPIWPGMYRIRRPDGSLSDMVNLTRAKDALAAMRGPE